MLLKFLRRDFWEQSKEQQIGQASRIVSRLVWSLSDINDLSVKHKTNSLTGDKTYRFLYEILINQSDDIAQIMEINIGGTRFSGYVRKPVEKSQSPV